MAARSANPRATINSFSSTGDPSKLKRFNAPMVASRSRSGSAKTDRKPAADCHCGELRPTLFAFLKAYAIHPLPGAKGVEARTLVGLKLKQLNDLHRITRGRSEPQLTGR